MVLYVYERAWTCTIGLIDLSLKLCPWVNIWCPGTRFGARGGSSSIKSTPPWAPFFNMKSVGNTIRGAREVHLGSPHNNIVRG